MGTFIHRHILLALAITLMAMFVTAGAPRAAHAGATSPCADCLQPCPDLGEMGMHCAPACTAAMPSSSAHSIPPLQVVEVTTATAPFVQALHHGPEPPPPRVA